MSTYCQNSWSNFELIFFKELINLISKMTFEKNNPFGVCMGLDVSVGAMKTNWKHLEHKSGVSEYMDLSNFHVNDRKKPPYRFIDEKYLAKVERKQSKYIRKLKKITKNRLADDVNRYNYSHNLLLCLVGPEWYQELSPLQKDVVDNLGVSIKKDLNSHLTNESRSSVSRLGLRPLPNDGQLWRALTRSYGCPVEFLLILYQLIKPDRLYYSINDRLLLSGVTHLCLRDTLKEMHIRFPSPPRVKDKKPPTPIPKNTKKRKRKYKPGDVYLQPFTNEWTQRTSKKYLNPFVQKPDCPYFSYICNLEKQRVLLIGKDVEPPFRIDDDVKLPCELFNDHLEAEEYYNFIFKPANSSRYLILRSKIYETTTPKLYPGILPRFMLKPKYPPPFKLVFDIKIYNEMDLATKKSRKVMRTICDVFVIPEGRSGQKATKTLKTYRYCKNIEGYLKGHLVDTDSGMFLCSICGGPEGKMHVLEYKPVKVKSWIKRPPKRKKKLTLLDRVLSEPKDFKGIVEVVEVDSETMRIRAENKIYVDTWNKLFENVKLMEKLKIEAGECVCPTQKSPQPENDCTCAIWNLPTVPKVPPKISCECKPEIEYIYVIPKEEKCDCKQKERDRATGACKNCGKLIPKDEKQDICKCTEILEACGDCVKKTPIKYPLLEEENANKTCDCVSSPDQNQEYTVGYVFVNNKNFKEKKCSCTEVASINQKISQLDYCRRETEKLIELLKCDCSKCKEIRQAHRFIVSGTRDACGGIIPVVGGVHTTTKKCNCLEKFEKRIQKITEYRKRMKAKLDLKSQKDRYIIGGVHQTPKGPLYNIAGVQPKTPCTCKSSGQISLETKKQEQLVQKLKENKYVISGVKEGDKENDYIMSGLKKKECKCDEAYENFMKKHNECLVNYENYLQYMKKEVDEFVEEMKERYQDAPVSGRKLLEMDLKEMPGGKPNFVVSGVKKPFGFGKSFVIGGIILNERKSEECVVAIESFSQTTGTKAISKCQRAYLCNYMTFGKNCGNPFQPKTEELNTRSSEELICKCISYESLESLKNEQLEEGEVEEEELLEKFEGTCACECPCGDPIKAPDDCTCAEESDKSKECICIALQEEVEEEIEEEEEKIIPPFGCTCGEIEEFSSGSATDPCLCGYKNCGCQVDEICVKECFYGPAEAWQSVSVLNTETDMEQELLPIGGASEHLVSFVGGPSKRYVILRKIPKKRDFQERILKKLLQGLADDGYPLARLPDCHRLPYFWLWMQFRMKKRWYYKDAIKNFKHCQNMWNHVELCKKKIPYPKLPLHCICGYTGYTWKESNFVFKMVREAKQNFYDKLRKNLVDFSREFFTTLSPYQYPTPPYLLHYFYAYHPSKPEDVVAEFIWDGHEHKDPLKYKSCLCK